MELPSVRVIVLGDSGVGKTTLLRAACREPTTARRDEPAAAPQWTTGCDVHVLVRLGAQSAHLSCCVPLLTYWYGLCIACVCSAISTGKGTVWRRRCLWSLSTSEAIQSTRSAAPCSTTTSKVGTGRWRCCMRSVRRRGTTGTRMYCRLLECDLTYRILQGVIFMYDLSNARSYDHLKAWSR